MKAVCRQQVPQDQAQMQSNAQNTPQNSGKGAGTQSKTYLQAAKQADIPMDQPWHCHLCYTKTYDQKLQKCPNASCGVKRQTKEKPQEEPPPKTLISKDIAKIIEGVEEEGAHEVQDPNEEKRLTDIIEYAVLKGLTGMKEDAQKQLEDLKSPTDAKLLKNHTKTLKEVVAEKVRILNIHEDKENAIKKKLEKAEEAAKKHVEAREAALEEEKSRHEKTMKAIEDDFKNMLEVTAKNTKDAKEELITLEVLFDAEVERLDKFIKQNTPDDWDEDTAEEPKSSQKEEAPKEVPMEKILAEMGSCENFKGLGMDQTQASTIAQGIQAILAALTKPQAEEPTQEETGWKTQRRRRPATAARQMEVDSSTVTGKRAAEEDAENVPPAKNAAIEDKKEVS